MPAWDKGPDGLRAQLGQLSWAAREYRDPRRVLLQLRVDRALLHAPLPRRRRIAGSAWGISVVRNENDIIEAVIRHHLAQDLAGLLVADNGSTDGTWQTLRSLAAADHRLHLVEDRWPRHDHAEKMSRLARLAGRAGADWIVPFDGDEFWFARDTTLGDYCAMMSLVEPEITVLHADWFNMAPVADPVSLDPHAEFLMDATPYFPGKIAVRTHPLVTIGHGNHSASRVGGVRVGEIAVAHLPYRGPAQVARKLRAGAAAEASSSHHGAAWHWQAGAKLADEQIAGLWQRIRAGESAKEIGFPAVGPMVRIRPLAWKTWDPAGEVPRVSG